MASETDAPPVPPTAVIRRAPKPPKPKKQIGRRPKAVTCERCQQTFKSATECREHECTNPKPMGRPRKNAPVAEPAPAEPPPFAEPHSKGYSTIYIGEDGADLAVPITEQSETTRRQAKPAPAPMPSLEVALPSDIEMAKLIDEYGELDRRKQLQLADDIRYDTLKRAIKSWFDQAPPDADGSVEGNVYRLHLSARERERKIRDMRELAEVIGMDKLLEIATVGLCALENILGKTRVEALAVEARTGSRRIKAVPKHPAGVA